MSKIVWSMILLLCLSCTKESLDDCPAELACTEVFVSIFVKILKENQPSYKPAKLEVVFADTGEKKRISENNYGTYAYINDGDMDRISKNGTTIYLIGKDGLDKELFNEKYVIGHDCCHVIKLSGKDEITLK
ncbi:MAG: hypothetical protein WAT46_18370 [Saprospiraceae bacterium]